MEAQKQITDYWLECTLAMGNKMFFFFFKNYFPQNYNDMFYFQCITPFTSMKKTRFKALILMYY